MRLVWIKCGEKGEVEFNHYLLLFLQVRLLLIQLASSLHRLQVLLAFALWAMEGVYSDGLKVAFLCRDPGSAFC